MPKNASAVTYAQVWGEHTALTYFGVDAYNTTPTVASDNTWAAAPNGMNYDSINVFIESGPLKDCNPLRSDCKPHPYASWSDTSGAPYSYTDTSTLLGSGGWYRWASMFKGSNTWIAQFCDGYGCYTLKSVNLKTSSSMEHTIHGGEASCLTCIFGTIHTQGNKYLRNNSWTSYCYDTPWKNVNGSITQCNSSNHGWSVTWNG